MADLTANEIQETGRVLVRRAYAGEALTSEEMMRLGFRLMNLSTRVRQAELAAGGPQPRGALYLRPALTVHKGGRI